MSVSSVCPPHEGLRQAYQALGLTKAAFVKAVRKKITGFPALMEKEGPLNKAFNKILHDNFKAYIETSCDNIIWQIGSWQPNVQKLLDAPTLTFDFFRKTRLIGSPRLGYGDTNIMDVGAEDIASWIDNPRGDVPWKCIRHVIILTTLIEESPLLEKFRAPLCPAAAGEVAGTNPPAPL